jgi:hypothetical protein
MLPSALCAPAYVTIKIKLLETIVITFLQILSVIAALSLSGNFVVYAPCVIPLAYILIMAPGTFAGGSDISLEKLQQQLSERWANADELAPYMKKYWVALEYSASATARQGNCTMLALISVGLAAYYYFKLNIEIPAYILGLTSVVLYVMATRVNKPLAIYKDQKFRTSLDQRFRNEWRLAVISIVAFAELFPGSGKHKFLAEIIENDDIAREIIKNWRR